MTTQSICLMCGREDLKEATIERRMTVAYEGKQHEILVKGMPVYRCESCGEVFVSDLGDRHVSRALRSALGLLQPEEIKAVRLHSLVRELSQREFAELLGVASESLCRWERGRVIQSRAHDKLIRAFAKMPLLFAPVTRALGVKELYATQSARIWSNAEPDEVGSQANGPSLNSQYALAA